MLDKIEEFSARYCIAVMTGFMTIIQKLPPVVSMGLPLLITAAVHCFLPRWAFLAITLLLWIPAAMGMVIFVVSCWPHIHRRDTSR